MKRLDYLLVDVFTTQAFGGNPLAVFTDGRGVSAEMMQRLAKELNLSETTFVMQPQNPANDFHVRIFTPARELPMAGHPTVGTAYVLQREGFIDLSDDMDAHQTHIIFEEGVGDIPVTLDFADGELRMITMQQLTPTFREVLDNRADFAAMLSLAEDDLHPDYPIQVVSTGVPFTYIPIRSLEAIRRARLRVDLWQQLLGESDANEVFIFTPETVEPTSTVHSRMFAPSMGIAEDPATGAASGPLGCYLVQYGIADGKGMISEQGFEMGRPSYIHINIDHHAGNITRVQVGGQCVMMGGGYFLVEG